MSHAFSDVMSHRHRVAGCQLAVPCGVSLPVTVAEGLAVAVHKGSSSALAPGDVVDMFETFQFQEVGGAGALDPHATRGANVAGESVHGAPFMAAAA